MATAVNGFGCLVSEGIFANYKAPQGRYNVDCQRAEKERSSESIVVLRPLEYDSGEDMRVDCSTCEESPLGFCPSLRWQYG
eukprot:6477325-Amphidinium_carterae.1